MLVFVGKYYSYSFVVFVIKLLNFVFKKNYFISIFRYVYIIFIKNDNKNNKGYIFTNLINQLNIFYIVMNIKGLIAELIIIFFCLSFIFNLLLSHYCNILNN